MSKVAPLIHTVGHSTRTLDAFLSLLAENSIDVIADVRSSPYSSRLPQFNREVLADTLREKEIRYVFMGDQLGGRATSAGLINSDGQVSYTKMSETTTYREGITRLIDGAARMRIALLCSEKDPLNCHRGLLVARSLATEGVDIRHILDTEVTETHTQYETRLLDTVNLPPELTRTEDEILADAYAKQAARVAYKEPANRDEDSQT